jgi:cytochrome c biogenesis protein CcmG, thiol:disulfide interchange protein DsbE
VAIAIVAASVLLGSCVGSSGAGNPDSELSLEQATAPLEGAPPPLASIRDQANQILDGGLDAYDARIEGLRGFPIVINNWGSWCGPCRLEFPYFQSVASERAKQVAFLGVDTDDSEDAAKSFLEKLPMPYPSYSDPNYDISDDLDVGRRLPATAFYNRAGERVHTRIGVYTSAEQLAADIDRYTG